MENYIIKVSYKTLGNIFLGFSKKDGLRIVGICRVVKPLKFKKSKRGKAFQTGDLIFLIQIDNKSSKANHPQVFERGQYCRADEVEVIMKKGTPMIEEIGILKLSDNLYIVPADSYDHF